MSKNNKKILVDGFLFHDQELAQQAKREVEGVRYVKNKNSMDNPQLVLEVYDKLLNQQLFETPVGIGYLRELQEYLYTNPEIPNEDIAPIPVDEIIGKHYTAKNGVQKSKGKSGALWLSLGVNVMLALLVAAMFALTLSSRLPTILNYKEEILNEYAAWEQELTQREEAVRLREQALGSPSEQGQILE